MFVHIVCAFRSIILSGLKIIVVIYTELGVASVRN